MSSSPRPFLGLELQAICLQVPITTTQVDICGFGEGLLYSESENSDD